ncbi:hypothetical protein EW145_g3681 [Phellinidium pouzarii]|uniref:Transmembrane protein n=1 Tax=Phellinidium pouzarii TaxID=167371 RepID=A0A4S4L6G2_9AGAM|nr:hypothetical protein EW145_g3681 [Phellinidium pouzarii]
MVGADSSTGSATDSPGAWLRDEYRIVVYALVSLVVVVGGHCTWQEYHKYTEAAARKARILRSSEVASRKPEEGIPSDPVATPTHGAGAHVEGGNTPTPAPASTRIAKRSKERRKRGRDVLKDVLKQERNKSKTPAAAPAPQPRMGSRSHPQMQATSENDRAGLRSSRSHSTSLAGSSRSSSGTRSVSDYESTEDTPRPKSTEWTLSHTTIPDADSTLDVPQDSRSDYSSTSDSQSSSLGISTQISSQTSDDHTEREQLGATKPATPPILITHSDPSDCTSAGAGRSSPVSSSHSNLIVGDADTFPMSISQPVPYVLPSKSQPSWLGATGSSTRMSRAKTHPNRTHPKMPSSGSTASLAVSDASWDSETPYHRVGSKSPPSRLRSLSRTSVSPLPMAPSVSAMSPTSTPPPSASLQAQAASYKGALEAARKREETYRRELEKFKQECDVLRYRWNEDAERRRRREAEVCNILAVLLLWIFLMSLYYFKLEAQLQHVTSQLQSLSLTVSQMQIQSYIPPPQQQPGGFPLHPHLPFGYPPPVISSPGSSAMPLHPHAFPYPFFSSHPHMAPRNGSNSNIASPSREYTQPTFAAFDRLGKYDDDLNEELAEVILKHPESIRSPSSTSPSGSASGSVSGSGGGGSRSASVAGRAARDGFTFASLSELGNPQPRRPASSLEKGWIPYRSHEGDQGKNCETGNDVMEGVVGTSHDNEDGTTCGEVHESAADAMSIEGGCVEGANESPSPHHGDRLDGGREDIFNVEPRASEANEHDGTQVS